MRFSYAESMTDPSSYLPLARAAEDAGYDSMVVPDSICYPLHSDSVYPFNPDGTREFLEDKPFLEPFSLIPALGAVTQRLRFVTFVLKLPVRNPVLVAKQATSTAVLTGNRLVLGVGTSPWREDYEVTGVPWADRGQRMDEEIADHPRAVGRAGTSSTTARCSTCRRDQDQRRCRSEPLPILIGGHGDAALRRAARTGDGWLHGGGDPARPARAAGPAGRVPPRPRHRGPPVRGARDLLDAYTVDGVRRLEEQGVTDAIVGFRWPYATGPDTEPLADKLAKLRRFADDVIAKVRA